MMATTVDNNIDIGTGARWLHLLTTTSTEVRGGVMATPVDNID